MLISPRDMSYLHCWIVIHFLSMLDSGPGREWKQIPMADRWADTLSEFSFQMFQDQSSDERGGSPPILA